MIPEIGNFAIILALCFALLQAVAPLCGRFTAVKSAYNHLSTVAVFGQFMFLGFALLCLIVCFLNNDMSVVYVYEHSHQSLPLTSTVVLLQL